MEALAKKSSLFLEINQVKSLTRLHNQMCISICIFNFKKQTNKQKYIYTKKAKETKERREDL